MLEKMFNLVNPFAGPEAMIKKQKTKKTRKPVGVSPSFASVPKRSKDVGEPLSIDGGVSVEAALPTEVRESERIE